MRLRNRSLFVAVVLALVPAACGYFMAGSWDDDPRNWKRAFNSTKPAAVVVVHSKYWRSPHWTYEFRYFFELVPTAELKQQLFTKNDLRQVTGEDAAVARQRAYAAPAWFVPKALGDYDVWIGENTGGGHFTVFIDRSTSHLFLTDYQL